MEDREISVDEPRRIEQYDMKPQVNDVKPQVNGDHRIPSSSPQQPPKKRIRYTEPPIWAQSVRKMGNFASKVNGKQAAAVHQPQVGSLPLVKAETNGNRQVSPAATRQAPPDVPDDHPSLLLGPWEYSITGNKVNQQMTKLVADFIYLNVVSRGDLGELASRGVDIEIEAKLGQLVDKETNERYRLPVQSECILMESNRVGFRSSMTESQHRSLNDFLNAKVAETHPANPGQIKRRVKIDYLHRREIDKFYELPPAMNAILPAAVRHVLNPRHTVKVRVTHDQKTNQVLAKIIKARIVDLDIYNPQSPLDCRISINFEMKFDGEIEDILAMGIGERIPDRSKDRLSYTQSHYQIDLTQVTQVTSINGINRVDKEHELEIEVSTEAIMDQGRKAASGEPNEYMALVEGLIDNVRVLARNVPPP
ncbi:mRNA triphosphatase CET1 [Hyaloscypha hepaticicola]|uniref:mRNA-capping enzyme subunit beta n=1 Tax=Hyaloscypha hepaticicola TaxID=2082293 RepID=A0A2J6PEV2_9HELO|nr:mRNA triphosphatase CET1 [Hyaloscypha hepaticicola]